MAHPLQISAPPPNATLSGHTSHHRIACMLDISLYQPPRIPYTQKHQPPSQVRKAHLRIAISTDIVHICLRLAAKLVLQIPGTDATDICPEAGYLPTKTARGPTDDHAHAAWRAVLSLAHAWRAGTCISVRSRVVAQTMHHAIAPGVCATKEMWGFPVSLLHHEPLHFDGLHALCRSPTAGGETGGRHHSLSLAMRDTLVGKAPPSGCHPPFPLKPGPSISGLFGSAPQSLSSILVDFVMLGRGRAAAPQDAQMEPGPHAARQVTLSTARAASCARGLRRAHIPSSRADSSSSHAPQFAPNQPSAATSETAFDRSQLQSVLRGS